MLFLCEWGGTVCTAIPEAAQLQSASFFQMAPKKLKVHDSFQVMHDFAQAWKQYPILYDEHIRNRHFSEDFKGTGVYMRQCYDALAAKLNTTPEDVRKRWIKYVDAVTKALGQLKYDIMNDMTQCPIPAMYKLIAFRWLWPYSKNYDEQLMEGVVFNDYMECALMRDLKKLTRAKQDTSLVLKALTVVRDFQSKKALAKLDLKTANEVDADADVFSDASALIDIDEVEQCWMMTTVCAYLPPSRDPTFKYAKAGYAVFQDSVAVCDPSCSGKGIHRRSDMLLSALRHSGEAAAKATQAFKHAKDAEHLYYGSRLAILAHNELPALGDKSEHSIVQLQTEVLRRYELFQQSVLSAVKIMEVYKQEYAKLCDTAQHLVSSCSASRLKQAIEEIAKLRKLHDKSKMYSSDKWICVLINQL